jgi:transglutaminase-like putative cysteine protease
LKSDRIFGIKIRQRTLWTKSGFINRLAWSLFGGIQGGWQRAQAICNYAHQRIEFGYHHARGDRTASKGHEERRGVCRDFAHLAVTLFRCMNIPARYCTGYLSDIGVPADPAPRGLQRMVRGVP